MFPSCSQGRNQTSQKLRQVRMTQRRSPNLLWKDQKPRNNLQKRLLNMTKKKEFISTRRKSFLYISHGITTGIKNMATMAWERLVTMKTEADMFSNRRSNWKWSFYCRKHFYKKNVLFCKNKQINIVVLFYKVVLIKCIFECFSVHCHNTQTKQFSQWPIKTDIKHT